MHNLFYLAIVMFIQKASQYYNYNKQYVGEQLPFNPQVNHHYNIRKK